MNIRQLALEALLSGEYISNTAEKLEKKYRLSDLDRRFFMQLVLGVTKNKILLDYIIDSLSTVDSNNIDNKVRVILQLGVYQIASLDIPDFAAVNESVVLAKRMEVGHAKGFINAILRNYIRQQDKIKLPSDRIARLSVKYSFPEWLISKWDDMYGPQGMESLILALNQKAPFALRVNSTKTTRESLINALENAGVVAKGSVLADNAVLIKKLGDNRINKLPGFKEGHFIVQDESSQLVVEGLEIDEDDICIDVCASPGGKTTHLAEKSKHVHSFDHKKAKLSVVVQNLKRLGLSNRVKVAEVDAMIGDPRLIDKASVVLVDAPCSGFGILRRKPDIKYNRKPRDIKRLIERQRAILQKSSDYVKIGGRLVYSTCTLIKEENEDRVAEFLSKNDGFRLISQRTLLPSVDGCDGFYIGIMERK